MAEVTAILARLDDGDASAAAELLPLVYDELRKLAAARMRRLPPGQTLQPTALVHEAFLKLTDGREVSFHGRGHFFGAAALAMRDLLVDAARHKGAAKRGGGVEHVELDEAVAVPVATALGADDVVALSAAVDRLKGDHPRQAEALLLSGFAGLSALEVAQVLEVDERTVERDLRFARAFLRRELSR